MSGPTSWRGNGRRYPAERLYWGRSAGWWVIELITVASLATLFSVTVVWVTG